MQSFKVMVAQSGHFRRFGLANPTIKEISIMINKLLGETCEWNMLWEDPEGDLCYLTSEIELKEALASCAGKVVKLRVSRRGTQMSGSACSFIPSACTVSTVIATSLPFSTKTASATVGVEHVSKGTDMKEKKRPAPLVRSLPMSGNVDKPARRASSGSSSGSSTDGSVGKGNGGKDEEMKKKNQEQDKKNAWKGVKPYRSRASKSAGVKEYFARRLDERRWACNFVEDLTLPNGTIVQPGLHRKVWVLRNVGSQVWSGCRLAYVGGKGPRPIGFGSVDVAYCAPFSEVRVAMDVVVPNEAGRFMGFFKLVRPTGQRFGPRLWVELVCEGGESGAGMPVEERLTYLAQSIEAVTASRNRGLIMDLLVLHRCDVNKVLSELKALDDAVKARKDSSLVYWLGPSSLAADKIKDTNSLNKYNSMPNAAAFAAAALATAAQPAADEKKDQYGKGSIVPTLLSKYKGDLSSVTLELRKLARQTRATSDDDEFPVAQVAISPATLPHSVSSGDATAATATTNATISNQQDKNRKLHHSASWEVL